MPHADTSDGHYPAFTAVYTFGDSLVDPGNALRAAAFVGSLPFASLPDGAPTPDNGYFEGRFTDGFNFADLISNKLLGHPTQATWPYGFEDTVFDLPVPFVNRPEGNSLNFAFGGSQVRQYGDRVPTFDDQTDAYRNLGADPNGLYVVAIGGNDLRQMVEAGEPPLPQAEATARMTDIAGEVAEEVTQLLQFGARHVMVVGMPDIGILPEFKGAPNEAAARSLATQYAHQLEGLVQGALAGVAEPAGAKIYQFSLIDFSHAILADPQAYGLTNVTDARTVVQRDALESVGSGFLFFDRVHPSAQTHALAASAALDLIREPSGGMDAPAPSLAGVRLLGSIDSAGGVDGFSVSLTAGRTYAFDLLGISSGSGSLPDPHLRLVDAAGALGGVDDDNGLALDSHLEIVAPATGTYLLQAMGVGVAPGSYRLQASEVGGADLVQTGQLRGSNVEALGGPGDDTLAAEAGGNILRGAEGNDLLLGGVAFDDMNGNKGEDTLRGGAGGDWVVGGQGRDVLAGEEGGDLVFGGLGDDIVRGGRGADAVDGGEGADWLAGDRGDDTLAGGGGADVFYFHADANLDLVTDFSLVQGDRILLAPGTPYAVEQIGDDVVVSLGTTGRLILADVALSSLTPGWIVL